MAHLTRVRARLALHPHRKVTGLWEGGHDAVQLGRGHDFNDLRTYVRGDDVKDIDWKASARNRQLLVKRYVVERQHRVQLCVSTGRSMAALDAAGAAKRELAVLVAGVLGFWAVRNGDRVALTYGDAAGQHALPSGASTLHLERLLVAAHDATVATGAASDLTALLEHTARTVRRRSILVVIADDPVPSPGTLTALRRLSAQHSVVVIGVGDLDPTARTAPIGLRDVDGAGPVPDWLRHDAGLREEYAALLAREEADWSRRLDQLGIGHARIGGQDEAVGALLRLVERQNRARR